MSPAIGMHDRCRRAPAGAPACMSRLSWTAMGVGPSQRGLPRAFGHRAGVAALRPATVEAAPQLGVERLTVFGFSTEKLEPAPTGDFRV